MLPSEKKHSLNISSQDGGREEMGMLEIKAVFEVCKVFVCKWDSY